MVGPRLNVKLRRLVAFPLFLSLPVPVPVGRERSWVLVLPDVDIVGVVTRLTLLEHHTRVAAAFLVVLQNLVAHIKLRFTLAYPDRAVALRTSKASTLAPRQVFGVHTPLRYSCLGTAGVFYVSAGLS